MSYTELRRAGCLLLLTASLASLRAGAQDLKVPDTPEVLNIAPAPSERFPAKWYPRVGDGTDVLPGPVTGKPYTAVVQTTTPFQSPSGERQQQRTSTFQARDRFGRTRNESENGGMTIGGQSEKTKVVMVSDPVSHCQFHWTEFTTGSALPPEMRVAFVTCGPQTLRYKEMDVFGSLLEAMDGTTNHGDTTTRTVHLPPVQMDGVTVNRLRVTNVRRDEQGHEKEWSAETWYSPNLQELIRMGDEESGYTTLTNIVRTDPDPKLFYPPEGFRIELQPDR